MTNLSSVLIAENMAVRHAVSYLFTVVLKTDFDAPSIPIVQDCAVGRFAKADLVIVHFSEQDNDRLQLLREINASDGAPVTIVLESPKAAVCSEAFLAGASDVMCWPGSLYELALRSFLRLGRPLDDAALQSGGRNWELCAFIAERSSLSMAEAQILRILFDNSDEIVSRDDLSLELDGRPWRYGDRKFDVHIAKIRKKFADTFGPSVSVETVRSEGYRFSTKAGDFVQEALIG